MARDQPRPAARDADAAAAAGRRRLRQDDRRGARRAAGDRKRQAGRVHGADGNPRRAAFSQAAELARRRRRARSRGFRDRCRRSSGARRVEALASGEAPFAVGTHALFQEGVAMPQLGLAIVDEQHRFGVAQRLALRDKGLAEAHQLMMSATPIPRTLAMTFYADLDVSVLDEMPPGRTPVTTRLVSQKRRAEIIQLGRQGVPRRAAGVLGVPADRGIGKARAADGGRVARGADARVRRRSTLRDACRGRTSTVGSAARPHEARREGGDDGRVRARRNPRARRDDRDRGRRRRAERVDHGDRARGAVRARAIASAARARRPRRRRKARACCCSRSR